MDKSVTYNQDCLEAMRAMPDKAFDLAIVDPPYGLGNWVQVSGNVRGEAVTWNNAIPSPEYFSELSRVSRERIIWGANYYNCFNGRGGAIIWNKSVPRESNMSVCEIASYSRLARVDYVDLPWRNILRTEATIHPCQKPVALYKWLLQNYAKPDDTILDTHLGSQSSRIAAWDLGFSFTGFELDYEYFTAGNERFEKHRAQGQLFSPSDAELQPVGVLQNLFDAPEYAPLV